MDLEGAWHALQLTTSYTNLSPRYLTQFATYRPGTRYGRPDTSSPVRVASISWLSIKVIMNFSRHVWRSYSARNGILSSTRAYFPPLEINKVEVKYFTAIVLHVRQPQAKGLNQGSAHGRQTQSTQTHPIKSSFMPQCFFSKILRRSRPVDIKCLFPTY